MKICQSTLKYFLFGFILFSLIFSSCEQDNDPVITVEQDVDPVLSFEEKLSALPDFFVADANKATGVYVVFIKQPVDHNNPGGPSFLQQIYIKHTDESYPVEIRTSGYELYINSKLDELFPYNFVGVEHRYFGSSKPDVLNWEYLTIEQAAADHHKIIESLNTIYTGKWVSTGHSKGGMTALFHKRFYPTDVDATVTFGSPIILGLPDPRFKAFFDAKGTEDCRNKIKEFQRIVLKRKGDLIPLIEQDIAEAGVTVSMDMELLIEYTVLEYQFYFWQFGLKCGLIPDETESNEAIADYLIPVWWYFADWSIEKYRPFYYQAYTQIGYYDFIDEHLEDLLTIEPRPSYRSFGPENVEMTYDNTAMTDISDWLTTSGNNIIYIYGEDDPYTATAVSPGPETNALKIVQPNAAHNYLNIVLLDQQQQIFSALEEWLGVEIN